MPADKEPCVTTHHHFSQYGSDLKKRGELLDIIPGVGAATIAQLLILLSSHRHFSKAKQVVAFAGLAPEMQPFDSCVLRAS